MSLVLLTGAHPEGVAGHQGDQTGIGVGQPGVAVAEHPTGGTAHPAVAVDHPATEAGVAEDLLTLEMVEAFQGTLEAGTS